MKNIIIALLTLNISLCAASKKIDEFVTDYHAVVDKDAKKILGSQHPAKHLSYDMLNNWKVTAKYMVVAANNAGLREMPATSNLQAEFIRYAEQFKRLIDDFAKEAYIIAEQYPIYSHKKSLFKTKSKYTDAQKTDALSALKKTVDPLGKIAERAEHMQTQVSEFKNKLVALKTSFSNLKSEYGARLYPDNIKLFSTAIAFAEKVAAVATKIADEIKSL
jgi:hypothetical protein